MGEEPFELFVPPTRNNDQCDSFLSNKFLFQLIKALNLLQWFGHGRVHEMMFLLNIWTFNWWEARRIDRQEIIEPETRTRDWVREQRHPVPNNLQLKDSQFLLPFVHLSSPQSPWEWIREWNNEYNERITYWEKGHNSLFEPPLLSKSTFRSEHFVPLMGGVLFLQQLNKLKRVIDHSAW